MSNTTSPIDPLRVQAGGSHYKDLKIQPVEYCHANNIPFIEGSVIKYVTRHRSKNGRQDLEKAIHFLQLLIRLEYEKQEVEPERLPVPAHPHGTIDPLPSQHGAPADFSRSHYAKR